MIDADGLSEVAETIVNAQGGKHSKLDYRFDLIDARTLFKLAQTLHTGATKYNDHDGTNWKKITTHEHLNHALGHIFAYLAGDNQDDHLDHAFCRLMMAGAVKDSRSKNFFGPITLRTPRLIKIPPGENPKEFIKCENCKHIDAMNNSMCRYPYPEKTKASDLCYPSKQLFEPHERFFPKEKKDE